MTLLTIWSLCLIMMMALAGQSMTGFSKVFFVFWSTIGVGIYRPSCPGVDFGPATKEKHVRKVLFMFYRSLNYTYLGQLSLWMVPLFLRRSVSQAY